MGFFSDVNKQSQNYKVVKKLLKSGGKKFGAAMADYLGGHPDYTFKAACAMSVNRLGVFIIGTGTAVGIYIPGDRIINIKLNTALKEAMEVTYISENGANITVLFMVTHFFPMLASGIARMQSLYPAPTTHNQLQDIPDQIKKLAELKDMGAVSEQEFEQKKTELLAKI